MRSDIGSENTLYIHVTFLPHIGATGELKTKPTQHSVRELRGLGIQPKVIIARSDYPVPDDVIDKIALFCDVEPRGVVPLITASSIYEVPLLLEDAELGDYLVETLALEAEPADLADWRKMVAQLMAPEGHLRVAIVGKYTELRDAYMSVREALQHAGVAHGCAVDIVWINSVDLERGNNNENLTSVDGIIVPGGFGHRGIEGMILAAQQAREHKIPYLGLCLGMQVMCIEYARNVLGWVDANSTEFDQATTHPVIALMPDQQALADLGGTMRLGHYPCMLAVDSKAADAYGTDKTKERHRHRFEVNNDFRQELEAAGLRFSGLSPDGRLVEIAEVAKHPFMLGSQFHPEFQSRPNRPHPLFLAFIQAAQAHQKAYLRTHKRKKKS
jgi:CTP synthase